MKARARRCGTRDSDGSAAVPVPRLPDTVTTFRGVKGSRPHHFFSAGVENACSATAAAFETLSEPNPPAGPIRTIRSHSPRVRSRRPGPSAPSTMPTGRSVAIDAATAPPLVRLPVEADEQVARVAQPLHRVPEIAHAQVGLPLERAGGGLGERAGLGRGVAGGGDDGARAEHLGRAQDRARVVRVGHAVEQHDARRPAARSRDVLEPAPVERAHLERRALVDGAGIERHVEAPRVGDLGLDPGGADRLAKPVERVARDHEAQPLAQRVGERVAHGVDPEEPDRARGRGAPVALLLDHPFRLLRHARPSVPRRPVLAAQGAREHRLTP